MHLKYLLSAASNSRYMRQLLSSKVNASFCVLQLKAIEALLKSQPVSDGKTRLSDVGIGTPWELQGNNIFCTH